MRTTFRSIGAWAPLPAALSMVAYAVALELWPRQAGQAFAAIFRLNPFTLTPLHGWSGAIPGIVVWVGACYAVAGLVQRWGHRGERTARSLARVAPPGAAHPRS